MNSATGWPKGNPRRGAGGSLSRRGRTGFRLREGTAPGAVCLAAIAGAGGDGRLPLMKEIVPAHGGAMAAP